MRYLSDDIASPVHAGLGFVRLVKEPIPSRGLRALLDRQRRHLTVTGSENGSDTTAPFEVAVTVTLLVPLGVVTTGVGGVFV